MNSYNDLVTKILNIPVLNTAVNDIIASHKIFNLVSLKWKETILNSDIYKKHLEHEVNYSQTKSSEVNFKVYIMNGMDYNYHVLVAGCWKFHILKKNNTCIDSIVCNSCLPLTLIGKSMAEHSKKVFVDNSRFFFQNCDASVCSICEDVKKISFENNIWCVKNTKVFNGQQIRYLLRRDVLKAFGNSRMYGILRLKVSSRTNWGDNKYKIGGLCAEMILFNESSLEPHVDLERLLLPIETPQKPEITYPEDAEAVKAES